MIKNFLKRFKFYRLLNYFINKKYKNFINLNLKKNSIVIDVGANIGIISQLFYDVYNCRIESYEPGKYAFFELKKRFKKNKKVKVYNVGLSNKNYNGKIFYPKNYFSNKKKYSVGSSSLKKSKELDLKLFDHVKIKSIKNLINKHKYVDLIKLDCEGEEYNILPILIKNKKKIGKVICELHGNPYHTNNSPFKKNYIQTIKTLKEKNLLNNWFVQHF